MQDNVKDICPYCAASRDFGLWANAHWDETLIATCAACGGKYRVLQGVTYPMRQQGEKSPNPKARRQS